MQILKIAFAAAVVTAGASAHTVNPPVENASGLVLHSTVSEFAGRGGSAIVEPAANIEPGQIFTITGDCVAKVASAEQLRVVMTMADTAGGDRAGFRSMVAIDQQMRGNSLQVRVPAIPDAANHTFEVRVFRLGESQPEMCAAGSIRIGGIPAHPVG